MTGRRIGRRSVQLSLPGLRPSRWPRFPTNRADQLLALLDARRISTLFGVGALLGLAFVGDGELAARLAQFALVALTLATVVGWWELVRTQNNPPPITTTRRANHASRAWFIAVLIVTFAAG